MKTDLGKKSPGHRLGTMRFLAIVLLGVLTGCGGGGDTGSVPQAAPALQAAVSQVKAGTWVIMGSSTAAGAGAPKGKGWADLLQVSYAPSGAGIANLAKGGSVTYEGLSVHAPRVAGRPAPDPAANIDQALSRQPVLLIISYPTNDTALGYSVDETVKNLLAIREQALTAGVPVIMTSTQPRNLSDTKIAQMRTIDSLLANSIGKCFVDVRQLLADAQGHLAPGYDSGDGVHPNEAGHSVVAAQISQVLSAGSCVQISGPRG